MSESDTKIELPCAVAEPSVRIVSIPFSQYLATVYDPLDSNPAV